MLASARQRRLRTRSRTNPAGYSFTAAAKASTAPALTLPAEIAPGRHGQQKKNEQVLLPELEVGPQRHDRQEANQRDPAERLPGDRPQQPADGREQSRLKTSQTCLATRADSDVSGAASSAENIVSGTNPTSG